MAELREAIGWIPRSPIRDYTLGVTLWQQGDSASAVEQLEQAVRLKPDYAEAYYTLGSVYKQMNKLPEAAQALREALKLQPDFAGAHTTLAAVLRQTERRIRGRSTRRGLGAELARKKTGSAGRNFCYELRKKTSQRPAIAKWRDLAIPARHRFRARLRDGSLLPGDRA